MIKIKIFKGDASDVFKETHLNNQKRMMSIFLDTFGPFQTFKHFSDTLKIEFVESSIYFEGKN
ncbi:hypothetical protein ACFO26_01545 [Lactococcus nasutitermitis]|uniref:Uncharacterized protein n=1 Tax=Lactococcus nasutitermitis TaxID=1652957 RepID=A0ABV9JC80_9LACT|nr:hypothetical protein [Lactococcus nasutitermitis]